MAVGRIGPCCGIGEARVMEREREREREREKEKERELHK